MSDRAGKGAPIERCLEVYPKLLEAAREIAQPLGYAIGVHGSMLYDLDLIAAPWSEPCVSPQELAEALVNGLRVPIPDEDDEGITFLVKSPRKPDGFHEKPHGRLACTIMFWGHLHIDLSVMPMATPATEADRP